MIYSVYLKKTTTMKKVHLSVLTVACLGNFSFAQKADQQSYFNQKQFTTILSKETVKPSNQLKTGGDLVWSNDFSTPTDWTIDNAGQGAGFGWNINPTEESWFFNSVINSTSDGNFGELNNGTTTTQVINKVYTMSTTNPIDVNTLSGGPNNYILEFQQFGAKFYEKQEVYISTDNTNWVLAGDNSAIEMLTTTGGDVYANPTTKSINLSGFIPGGTNSLYIRFSWTSSIPASVVPNVWTAYGWMVDDVRILEAYADEFTVTKVWTGDIVQKYDYYSTPLSQVIPMTVGAVISNMGGVSQAKVVSIEILQGTTSVYTSTENITVLPGVSDTLWHTSTFTPTANGVYTVKFTLPTDAITTNNTQSENFEVTPNIYGHNFPITGTTSFGFTTVDAEIGMGNLFEINANQQLNGINVHFATGTTPTTEVTVELWENVDGIQGNLVFITDALYTIPSPLNTATPTTIPFNIPAQMEQGKLYLIILKAYQDLTNKLRIKSTSKGNDDFSTVGYGPFATGGGVNYFSGWASAPYISLNFDPTIGINENSTEISGVSIYPNPSSSSVNLEMNIANPSEVSIQVTDLSGKIVATQNLGFLTLGKNQTTIQSASFNNGLYYVTISSNGTSVTKKFIKN